MECKDTGISHYSQGLLRIKKLDVVTNGARWIFTFLGLALVAGSYLGNRFEKSNSLSHMRCSYECGLFQKTTNVGFK